MTLIFAYPHTDCPNTIKDFGSDVQRHDCLVVLSPLLLRPLGGT